MNPRHGNRSGGSNVHRRWGNRAPQSTNAQRIIALAFRQGFRGLFWAENYPLSPGRPFASEEVLRATL